MNAEKEQESLTDLELVSLAKQRLGELGPKRINRFLSKVVRNGRCWEWMGSLVRGYGRFGVNGQVLLAHRAAWELFIGEIPTGMCVLHRCDNRRCVNPEHLFLGTYADNVADMHVKGRARKAKGTDNARSKLTMEIAREIRKSPLGPRAEARRWGIQHSTVRQIRNGLTWKDL